MPQIALDDFLTHAQFKRRLFDECGALMRCVQVERVHVEPVAARDQQIDFQQMVAGVLGKPTDAVPPVVARNDDLLRAHFHLCRRFLARKRVGG